MSKANNLSKLVAMLNDGAYHDGTNLGLQLKMTRSAIWKMIKKLQSYDIKIDSIKGKGYALLEPLILLDSDRIKKLLDKEMNIEIFESIESTNNFFKQAKNNSGMSLYLAEQQTKGRGRFNREWYSPFGQNIYLSFFYPFEKDISELAGLSLVISLAIIKTLRNYNVNQDLFVKWPNDIVYAHKKLGGNLIEIQAETYGMSHAMIGIGLNVNMMAEEELISQPWTSVRKILGSYVDRNVLCANLVNNLFLYLQRFSDKGFSDFSDEWKEADGLYKQAITVINLNEKVTGTVMGINSKGHLLLNLPNGSIRAFSSGDTTIEKSGHTKKIAV